MTPLLAAVHSGHRAAVQALLSAGASTTAADPRTGNTALHMGGWVGRWLDGAVAVGILRGSALFAKPDAHPLCLPCCSRLPGAGGHSAGPD